MQILDADGRPFLLPQEWIDRAASAEQRAETEKKRAEAAAQRAAELAERLRQLGVDPDTLD